MRRDRLSSPSAAPLLEILEPRLLLAAALSINDVAVDEGNSGTTPAVFTVTLSQAIVADATVNWATTDGTATVAGNDYVAASGILTIPAGQTTGIITVVVKGDTVPESDKTIFLNIDYAEGADIVDGQGRCVILDDDGVFLPFGGKTKAQFNDANHEQVTVQLTGPGSGQVHLSAPDGVDALGVVLNGTTALSSLTITTTGLGCKTTVGGIVVNGSLNALTAKTTDLLGGVVVTGSLKTLQLDDVAGGSTISIGGPAKPTDAVTIRFDQVSDLVIDSRTPISTLTVTEWRDVNTPADAIRAPWLGRLTTTGRKADPKKGSLALAGDFEADLVLSGVGVANTGKTLGAAGIKGSMAPSVWDVTGKIGAVTVGGTVGATGQPWELKNATALASLTLGDVTSANVTVQTADVTVVNTLGVSRIVTVGGVLGAVKALRWTDGLIEADSLTSLSITGRRATATLAEVPADFSADVLLHGRNVGRGLTAGAVSIAHNLSGSTWNVGGNAGPVLAGSAGPDWVANFTGALGGFTLKGDATVRLAAKSIKAVSIGGNLTDSLILAGANLGSDVQLGGVGPAADTFGPGAVGKVNIGGQSLHSVIAAGLDPVDGVFNNAGDRTVGGAASAIKSLTVGGSLDAASRFFAAAFPKTVKIGGVTVNPLVDPRLVAGLADIGLSRSSANPGSTLAVTGSGFVPDATTDVIFTYDSGDALRLRAIPGSVTETQVEVIVPSFFDAEAFEFTSGTVSVGLDQGTNVLYTPVDGFEINALGATGEPAGSVLLETFELLRDQAQSAAVQWQVIEAASNRTVKSAAVVAALQGMRTELAAQRDRIEPLVAGRVTSIHLGKVNGRDVVLDSNSLGLIDQLLVTCFLGDEAPAPSGGGAASMLLGPQLMGGTDTMEEYWKKFNPDPITFEDPYKMFQTAAGIAEAGTHGSILVAAGLGKMTLSEAAAMSGIAGAGLFWFTVVTPVLMNEFAMSLAKPFIELEFGPGFTWDRQPEYKYLKEGSEDYIGGEVEGAVIGRVLKFDKNLADVTNLYVTFLEAAAAALTGARNPTAAAASKAMSVIYEKLSGAVDAVMNAAGVSRTQALRAILAAMTGNPNGDLVLSDANARASELIGAAEPGVLVSPTSGLVTTEGGGEATFTVVLRSKPTANVTIGLSSSDTTEGRLSKSSLVFTPKNWSVAQVVTVVGVDDSIVDGDQDYTIYTGSTVSSDPYYSGLPVDDVTATNKDTDEPIPGTISYFGMFSENYEIWGYDAHGNYVKTASGTAGFRLTIWMRKLGTALGMSAYEITRVMCSDPWFGAQMAVPAVYPSVATLGDPPKNLSDSGEGFNIFFPNGANLGTVNGAGAMHMSSDGRTISNSLDPSIQPCTWVAVNCQPGPLWEEATIPGFLDGGIITHSSWIFTLSAL